MKKKRICCFCEKWESGGIESFLCNVLTHMDLSELEIDIVVSDLENSMFTEPLEKLGVRFIELSGNPRHVLQNGQLFRALLKQRKYDVVHFNLFQGLSLWYARMAKAAGVPVRIVHSHNAALRKSRTRLLKLAIHEVGKRIWAKDATDYWACSRAAAEFLFPANYLKSYRFIPNGIDIRRFSFSQADRMQVRRELGLTEDQLLVGHVGRLCYQKNQSFLLEVFARLHADRPESRLILVGGGEDLSALKAQADRLGISEQVIFYGVTDRVERLLWAMDVFVFPSHFEGLSVVAVEAQAAGLPVLNSRNMSPEVCLTDGARMLCLEDGADAWAQAVSSASIGGDRSQGAQAVREKGFDITQTAAWIRNTWCGRKER